jgi:hypothetical protein
MEILQQASPLPVNKDKSLAWIQFKFSKPTTIKAITIVGGVSLVSLVLEAVIRMLVLYGRAMMANTLKKFVF